MDEPRENIFWKAAMIGKVIYPDTADVPPTAPAPYASGRQTPTKGRKRARYTPVEDHMILQAVEIHGRNWRNVLTFMNKHQEVLGKEASEKHRDVDVRDKKAHERIRKRVATLQEKHGEDDRFA